MHSSVARQSPLTTGRAAVSLIERLVKQAAVCRRIKEFSFHAARKISPKHGRRLFFVREISCHLQMICGSR